MKPRTEHDLQKAIIILAKMMAIDRSLPERRVKLLKIYHINNGVIPMKDPPGTPKIRVRLGGKFVMMTPLRFAAMLLGKRLKEMGVKEGMPDLHLPVAAYESAHHVTLSLYGEVKLPGVEVPEYQKIVHEDLRADGNRVDIWRSVDDAMRAFKEHLSL